MPLEPEFMRQFEAYRAERAGVRTLADWLALKAKWFDASRWPTKSSGQVAAESARKGGSLHLGGRDWGYSSWVYDLTPEARYEYFVTLTTIGGPLTMPGYRNQPKAGETGWMQECPYCEIWTFELGDEVCPQCHRPLVYTRPAD